MTESILDKVINSQKSNVTANFHPQEILNSLIKNLKEREVEVLGLRYGFTDNQPKTLEEIGKKFSVTRERIRQIENSALKKIKNLNNLDESLKSLEIVVNQTLEDYGGIMHEEQLIKEVLVIPGATIANQAAVYFILSQILNEKLHYLPDDEELHPSWKLPTVSVETVKNLLANLISVIEQAGQPISTEKIYEQLNTQETPADWQLPLNEQVVFALLSVSRKVAANPFGEWGLTHWETIALKRMSDKIYLVLKKETRPLHFKEIAEKINQIGFDQKTANPATIHNELILDEKYVLVGRGIYALKEWGYKPGVVAEVIEEILKATGPLSREEIIEKVMEKRLVKRSTIILALMNKDKFKKTPAGEYELAKLQL